MNDCIEIRDGTFQATIYLAQLDKLPRPKYRKLMRLMCRAEAENTEALIQLKNYYMKQIGVLQVAYEFAHQALKNGGRAVKNISSREKRFWQ